MGEALEEDMTRRGRPGSPDHGDSSPPQDLRLLICRGPCVHVRTCVCLCEHTRVRPVISRVFLSLHILEICPQSCYGGWPQEDAGQWQWAGTSFEPRLEKHSFWSGATWGKGRSMGTVSSMGPGLSAKGSPAQGGGAGRSYALGS